MTNLAAKEFDEIVAVEAKHGVRGLVALRQLAEDALDAGGRSLKIKTPPACLGARQVEEEERVRPAHHVVGDCAAHALPQRLYLPATGARLGARSGRAAGAGRRCLLEEAGGSGVAEEEVGQVLGAGRVRVRVALLDLLRAHAGQLAEHVVVDEEVAGALRGRLREDGVCGVGEDLGLAALEAHGVRLRAAGADAAGGEHLHGGGPDGGARPERVDRDACAAQLGRHAQRAHRHAVLGHGVRCTPRTKSISIMPMRIVRSLLPRVLSVSAIIHYQRLKLQSNQQMSIDGEGHYQQIGRKSNAHRI